MAGSSFPILFLSRTIGGVGATFLQSGSIAMLDSLYPASDRGNRFVMVYFCGGFGLTMGLPPPPPPLCPFARWS
eukprot:2464615-Rhodomonas_salina.1